MNFQEKLSQIKKLLFVDQPAPAADTTEYLLEDGTKITIEKMEVGAPVTIDGVPAPDGEHRLQDGTVIETKDGNILEIASPAAPDDQPGAEPPMDMESDKFKAEFETINEKFAAYEEKFTAYETRFKTAEETIAKQQDAIGQLLTVVEKLAAMPADQPAEPAKNQFTNEKSVAKEERFEAITAALKEMKK